MVCEAFFVLCDWWRTLFFNFICYFMLCNRLFSFWYDAKAFADKLCHLLAQITWISWTDFNEIKNYWCGAFKQRFVYLKLRRSTKNSCHVVGRLAVVQQVIVIDRVRRPSRRFSMAKPPWLFLDGERNKLKVLARIKSFYFGFVVLVGEFCDLNTICWKYHAWSKSQLQTNFCDFSKFHSTVLRWCSGEEFWLDLVANYKKRQSFENEKNLHREIWKTHKNSNFVCQKTTESRRKTEKKTTNLFGIACNRLPYCLDKQKLLLFVFMFHHECSGELINECNKIIKQLRWTHKWNYLKRAHLEHIYFLLLPGECSLGLPRISSNFGGKIIKEKS